MNKIALTLAVLITSGIHASSLAQNDASGNNHDIRQTVLEIDRLHIDAKRQLDLLITLGQITEAIEEIRPYGDSVLVLLDDSQPLSERWRRVLEVSGDTMTVAAARGGEWTDPPAEFRELRDRVEVLDAELQMLRGMSDMPFDPVSPPILNPETAEDAPNPELVLQEQLKTWELNENAVRYAQVGEIGVQPAVWLNVPSGGARLEVGGSTTVGERSIRLDKLDRGRDGRIRLTFNMDGFPVKINW